MAISQKDKICKTVGALKKFLDDIPDKTPLRSCLHEPRRVFLWKKDADESGPKFWVSVEDD